MQDVVANTDLRSNVKTSNVDTYKYYAKSLSTPLLLGDSMLPDGDMVNNGSGNPKDYKEIRRTFHLHW